MSGKEVEPVSAFFPSIDRNLMRELDRHLRNAQESMVAPEPAPLQVPLEPPPAPEPETSLTRRPDIASVLDAVEHAASTLAAMTERIQALEGQVDEFEAANHDLAAQLSEALQQKDALEASLETEQARTKRVEALAAHHVARGTALERELGVARADLAKVVEAITQALGSAPATG